MKLWRVLIAELVRRRGEAALGMAVVVVGVAAVVAAHSITWAGQQKITTQVHDLGANLIVLPRGVQVADYYTADFGDATLPEHDLERLCTSDLSDKVHNMTPKLSRVIRVAGRETILTGVLPQSELPKRPTWKSSRLGERRAAGVSPPVSHPEAHASGSPAEADDPPSPIVAGSLRPAKPRMTIKDIGRHEVLVGSELGQALKVSPGAPLEVLGQRFFVANVLPETGTIDDLRLFAHLHTVQELLDVGPVLSAIEIVGCGCHVDVAKLGRDIEELLPGTQTTTIRQIAAAQSNTMRIVKRFSIGLSVILLVIGGISIGNYMSTNVLERRREVGALMAIGARPSQVLSLFLWKAVLLGAGGGALGYAIGTLSAVWLGPVLAGVDVHPLPLVCFLAIATGGLFCLGFCTAPCLRATRIDPAAALLET